LKIFLSTSRGDCIQEGVGVKAAQLNSRCAVNQTVGRSLRFGARAARLCRLMCGRPLAFREACVRFRGYAPGRLKKGAEPLKKMEGASGKAEPYRTSSGRAAKLFAGFRGVLINA